MLRRDDEFLSEILVKDALMEGAALLTRMSQILWEAWAVNQYLGKLVDLKDFIGSIAVSMEQLMAIAETYINDISPERRKFLQNDITNIKITYRKLMEKYEKILRRERSKEEVNHVAE